MKNLIIILLCIFSLPVIGQDVIRQTIVGSNEVEVVKPFENSGFVRLKIKEIPIVKVKGLSEILEDTVNWASSTTTSLPADSITVTPTGNLGSTDAQSAFEELQGDIDAIAGGAGDGVVTGALYNTVTKMFDFTVAAPGSNFSVDFTPTFPDILAYVRTQIDTGGTQTLATIAGTSDDITEGSTKLFMTTAERTKLTSTTLSGYGITNGYPIVTDASPTGINLASFTGDVSTISGGAFYASGAATNGLNPLGTSHAGFSAVRSGYGMQLAGINDKFWVRSIDNFVVGATRELWHDGNLPTASISNYAAAYADKINSATYNNATDQLTLNQQDGGTVTVTIPTDTLVPDIQAVMNEGSEFAVAKLVRIRTIGDNDISLQSGGDLDMRSSGGSTYIGAIDSILIEAPYFEYNSFNTVPITNDRQFTHKKYVDDAIAASSISDSLLISQDTIQLVSSIALSTAHAGKLLVNNTTSNYTIDIGTGLNFKKGIQKIDFEPWSTGNIVLDCSAVTVKYRDAVGSVATVATTVTIIQGATLRQIGTNTYMLIGSFTE